MPVPTLVTDLSTTLASNSPAGSDNVFPDLDNYLRALSGFVASIRDNSGNGWVSPYLPLAGGTVTGATIFSSTVALNGALSGTGLTTYLASPAAIGGTTPAAGSFTTLSASGNVTLSGGTANGVLYLNGSKVATSGSALTFDGTDMGVGGAVESGIKLKIFGAVKVQSAQPIYYMNSDNTNNVQIANAGATGGSNGQLAFTLGGVGEGMRLTSTGLGIGTSSPAQKLHISTASATSAVRLTRTGTFPGDFTVQAGGYGTPSFLIYDNTAAAERLLIDGSGNLGLGVTPSAWSTASSRKAIQLGYTGGAAVFTNAAGNTLSSFVHNAYDNGTNWLYAASSVGAARYEMTGANAGSTHAWYVSAGGTAGNAISFTQAMTLDASGRLCIGATSGTEALNIQRGAGASGYIEVAGNNNGIGTASVLYGQDSSSNGYYWNRANAPILLGTNNNERARITSGGDLLVGTTSASGKFVSSTSANTTYSGWFESSAASGVLRGVQVKYSGQSPNDAGNIMFLCADSTASRMYVNSNGGIANYQANDVNLSDRREKTNFAPAKSYLDAICAIPVQTFNYIDQSEDDPGLTLGVVAQDVQAVAPELVMESNWGTEDNPKMRLSIYQTDLQYALMRCVQELKAELDATKARLAALEAQP